MCIIALSTQLRNRNRPDATASILYWFTIIIPHTFNRHFIFKQWIIRIDWHLCLSHHHPPRAPAVSALAHDINICIFSIYSSSKTKIHRLAWKSCIVLQPFLLNQYQSVQHFNFQFPFCCFFVRFLFASLRCAAGQWTHNKNHNNKQHWSIDCNGKWERKTVQKNHCLFWFYTIYFCLLRDTRALATAVPRSLLIEYFSSFFLFFGFEFCFYQLLFENYVSAMFVCTPCRSLDFAVVR